MFNTINEFKQAWDNEAQATMKVFDYLTDEGIAQKVTPGTRSLGFLGWHLASSLQEMPTQIGMKDESPLDPNYEPQNVQEIKEAYSKANEMLKNFLTTLNNETLKQEFDIYGERWSADFLLTALITHQIHHRGQMTVLMRQAGLKVPGIYGPSKEEWVNYGAPAQK